MLKKLLILSIIINAIFGWNVIKNKIPVYTGYKSENYEIKTGLFDMCEIKEADIVMFGSSIIQNANWNELLNNKNIINRGIGGDTTEGLRSRINQVIELKPKTVVIMSGINDVMRGRPIDNILTDYFSILETLKSNGIKPIVFAILERPNKNNNKVKKVNQKLQEYCHAKNIIIVDINKWMNKDCFVSDNLHLTDKGYKVWAQHLKGYLKDVK
jgi:lysophospholipase L1-like esterase